MTWFDLPDIVIRLAVAGLGGLAVGIEREWSRGARGHTPRFAGVRTFLLLGLIGGMAAELHVLGMPFAGAGLLANTLLKLAVAIAIGRGAFRRAAGAGLATLATGSAVALFLCWVPVGR